MRKERWLVIVPVLLVFAVAATAAQQVGVMLYKVALVTQAAVAGYWIDRVMAPYARPDQCDHAAQAGLRRAIIVAATMIAVGIGL